MASRHHLVLNESVWVRGETIDFGQRNAGSENQALRERGARILMVKSARDAEGLEQLRRELTRSDAHVILARLLAGELRALLPILRERGNFSIVVDDWWSIPHWFLSEASHILFRNYNGIAFGLGMAPFLEPAPKPPAVLVPTPPLVRYTAIAMLLRLPALAVSPLVDAWNFWRRRDEVISPDKYLYFPFPVDPKDASLEKEEILYDFANTGGTCGIWLMRDPRVSFRHTFANLYYDRQRLAEEIEALEGQPFTYYDWRRVGGVLPYPEYVRKNRQSRYLIASGGLQNTSVPKYLEYACVGTPMIGRSLPFECPWLDDCLFPIDNNSLKPGALKPLLHQALDRYPALRGNCLKWRDRLLELYSIHRLLDLVQSQANGKLIPADYLKGEALKRHCVGATDAEIKPAERSRSQEL
jgi:hypothetical protein